MIIFLCSSCTTQNDNLRLRIIANSNSEIDQINKLEVKEIIKSIYEETHEINYLSLEEEIKKHVTKDYKSTIKVEYRNELFPAKSYKGKFIPSGNYPTIVVTIGEGKGQNFWTILYPDFFNISFDEDNEVEYRSYIGDHIKKK